MMLGIIHGDRLVVSEVFLTLFWGYVYRSVLVYYIGFNHCQNEHINRHARNALGMLLHGDTQKLSYIWEFLTWCLYVGVNIINIIYVYFIVEIGLNLYNFITE